MKNKTASKPLCVFPGNWNYIVLNAIINARINLFSTKINNKKRFSMPALSQDGQLPASDSKSEISNHTNRRNRNNKTFAQTCITSFWACKVYISVKIVFSHIWNTSHWTLYNHNGQLANLMYPICCKIAIKGYQQLTISSNLMDVPNHCMRLVRMPDLVQLLLNWSFIRCSAAFL